jgi:hypothetical protein
MPARKGDTWNESETYRDAWTLRKVRRVTSAGLTNTTPTYHTNICFSEDGEFFIFASEREGTSAVFRADTPTDDITQLIDLVGGSIRTHTRLATRLAGGLSTMSGIVGDRMYAW